MPLLERTVPRLLRTSNICFRCRVLSSRGFQTSQSLAKKPKALPKIELTKRVQEKQHLGEGARKTYAFEDCLPPIDLLNAAKKAGALEMEPEKALMFLTEYMKASQRNITSWEERICKEQNITPETMAIIASILRRCPTPPQKGLGAKLMHSSSSLGYAPATYQIISTALQLGELAKDQIVQSSLQRLGLLAKKERDPKAMFLLGKSLYSQGAEKNALEWLRKATKIPTGNLEFDGAGEALVLEGLILARGGLDKAGAKAAWEKAARDLDEPQAYFYLSQLEGEGGNFAVQQVYLLKAASGGVSDAAHNLGVIELEKLMKGEEKKLETMDDYGMAREWFNVAAASGFGMSMLNMATICETVRNNAEALMWLKKAEGVADGDVVKQARARRAKLEVAEEAS